jgi:hypothetical protein
MRSCHPHPARSLRSRVRCLPRAGGINVTTRHFPAALRKASLILSCQPGPPSWKNSRTSWSMRKETSSFAKGIFGAVGTVSTRFLVTDLNAASAASFALSPRWRFRGGIIIFVPCDVRGIRRRGKPLCFAEMSSQDEHFNVQPFPCAQGTSLPHGPCALVHKAGVRRHQR